MAASEPPDFDPPPEWAEIYSRQPGLILGFHGCDKTTGEDVLAGRTQLEISQNAYDWLGSGIYFWEADPWRALQFAKEAKVKGYLTGRPIETPYVVGAIIDLGRCCNLLEVGAIGGLLRAYEDMDEAFTLVGLDMPKNTKGRRNLDRAVVEYMHLLRRRGAIVGRKRIPLPSYDTVRAAFPEGDELYKGSGFLSKNHIQIAVRDPKCIKGYFRLPGL
jgi:hypothetical protein